MGAAWRQLQVLFLLVMQQRTLLLRTHAGHNCTLCGPAGYSDTSLLFAAAALCTVCFDKGKAAAHATSVISQSGQLVIYTHLRVIQHHHAAHNPEQMLQARNLLQVLTLLHGHRAAEHRGAQHQHIINWTLPYH